MGVVVRFCGFYGRGFWRERENGFCWQEREALYWKCLQENGFTQWLKWVKTLPVSFILESQWLRPTWLKYYIGK